MRHDLAIMSESIKCSNILRSCTQTYRPDDSSQVRRAYTRLVLLDGRASSVDDVSPVEHFTWLTLLTEEGRLTVRRPDGRVVPEDEFDPTHHVVVVTDVSILTYFGSPSGSQASIFGPNARVFTDDVERIACIRWF